MNVVSILLKQVCPFGNQQLTISGHRESLAGDTVLSSDVGELQSSKCSTDSLHEEQDSMGMAPVAKEQSSGESLSRFSELWYDKLMMEAREAGEPKEQQLC